MFSAITKNEVVIQEGHSYKFTSAHYITLDKPQPLTFSLVPHPSYNLQYTDKTDDLSYRADVMILYFYNPILLVWDTICII